MWHFCFPFRRCRTERLWFFPPWRCWWSHGWWAGHQEGWWSGSNCRNSQLGYLCQVCTEEYMSTGESVPSLGCIHIPSADRCIPYAFLQIGFGRYFGETSVKNLQCFCHVTVLRIAHCEQSRDKQCSRIRCCSMQGLHPLCFGNSTGLLSKEGSAGSGMLRCVLKAKKTAQERHNGLLKW